MEARIVRVDATNVEESGFFCYKSKPKSEGYHRKRTWLERRFAEGLAIQIVYEGNYSTAFIEYIPGEYAWRAAYAPEYMFVHCLWVVGRGKGKGYATRMLEACEQEARERGLAGVAMATSLRNWLVSNKVLLKNGYQIVDSAPPSFDLLVKKFKKAADPAFPQDWEARLGRFGEGLTVIRADQCPYITNAVGMIKRVAEGVGLVTKVVAMESAREVQERSPSAYGLFGVVFNGELLWYHYPDKEKLREQLAERVRGG